MSNPGSVSEISSQDQQNHFKLRIELFQFETTTIEEHLKNYIGRIQRQHCNFLPPDAKILSHHDLLEFMLNGEQTRAPAFEFYHLQIQLVQQITPSRVFFIAQLVEEKTFFSNSSYIDSLHQPPGVRSTILKLNTIDGFLATPKVSKLSAQNELVVAQFKLAILLENFSFAPQPFIGFTPVETKKGCLNFPLIPSCQGQNPVQTHFYVPSHQPPPPQLAPPRLLRDDTNTSVPWNTNQQTYMSRDKVRHVQDVRTRFRSSSRPPVTQPRPQHSQQQDNVQGYVPNSERPVLPQTLPEIEVLQTPPVPLLQNDPSSAGPNGANLLPPRTDTLPVTPPTLLGAEGGTNVIPSRTETNDPPVVVLPGFTMTLPPPLNAGTRHMDPRDMIHDENDMLWDNNHLQFQLTSDVDFRIPARSSNPFVQPPLASSVQRNPSLPSISHDPHAIPDQTTVSPPMLHERTPALAPTVDPNVPTEVTTTGTRPKTPVMTHPLQPTPNPPTEHIVTRSETNSMPVPVQGFVQSVKKSLANTMNSKEKSYNTRSFSK